MGGIAAGAGDAVDVAETHIRAGRTFARGVHDEVAGLREIQRMDADA
jgi:hypothetical protein